jgi:UDP-N-acetyl-2-amino-2-deoxyglucuronate dehydrogenase
MNKIKFAIIGCGYIGKRHADMILDNEYAELVGLVDIKKEEDLEIDKYKVPFFNSIDGLFNNVKDIDVVNICTPNGFHAEQTLLALENECHVVCEKPLALSKHDAEKILFKSLERSKKVFCVMQNRYSPPSKWLKEIVDNKILGDIYMVQLNCYWNRDERYYKKNGWKGTKNLDGGTLFTQFSHFIDIMYWLFGDIKNVNTKLKDFSNQDLTEFEDSGISHFEFVSGGIGSINFSTSVVEKNLESSITIIGSKGSVKVGGQYLNEVEICNIPNYIMPELSPTNPGNDYGFYKGSASNHNYVIQNVIDTINDSSVITTNVLEGLKVVDIIERIYLANKSENG